MKKRSIGILIISAALIAVMAMCGLTSFGMVQFARAQNIVLTRDDSQSGEQRETRVFSSDGIGALAVFTARGDVEIKADENAADIRVEIVRSAWGESEQQAADAAQALQVDIVTSSDTLELRYEGEKQPPMVLFGVHNPASVSFIVTVPVEMAVTVESSFGTLALQGTHGDATLKNFFGGELRVVDLEGALRVEAPQAQGIHIQNVRAGQGEVSLNSSFGALEAQNISARTVTVECPSCTIALEQVDAQEKLNVRTDFNEIVLEDIRAGQAEITNQNGAVTMRGGRVPGALNIESSFGKLEVHDVVAGSYRLENQNGDILLDGASGVVEASGSFGNIEITNARDVRLTAESQQGAVRFSGSLDAGAAHSITTSFGNVTLAIPPESAFDLDLEAPFGKIRSELPVTLEGEMNETAWQGKLNGGGQKIEVKTQNGEINIEALNANTQP